MKIKNLTASDGEVTFIVKLCVPENVEISTELRPYVLRNGRTNGVHVSLKLEGEKEEKDVCFLSPMSSEKLLIANVCGTAEISVFGKPLQPGSSTEVPFGEIIAIVICPYNGNIVLSI